MKYLEQYIFGSKENYYITTKSNEPDYEEGSVGNIIGGFHSKKRAKRYLLKRIYNFIDESFERKSDEKRNT